MSVTDAIRLIRPSTRLHRVPAPMTPVSRRAAVLGVALVALCLAAHTAVAAETRLSGRVVDGETQAPIAGAQVELANASGGQGFFRARTDRQGAFTLERVPTERGYNLTIAADGYADFVLTYWQIPAPQRAGELLVPLDRAGTLEVRAAAGGKAAIAGAKVTLRSEAAARWWEGARPGPAPVFTDRGGLARFVDLPAGAWTVVVEAPGLLTQELRRVTLRRGETTSLPIALLEPGRLEGTLKLPDGGAAPFLTVMARGPAEGVGTSDDAGNFTIVDLPPGRYRLEVAHDGFMPLTSKESYTLAEGATRSGLALTVTPRAPEFSFVVHREVFTPEAPVRIGQRAFRVGEVEMTLFEVSDSLLLDPRRDVRALARGPDTTGLVVIDRWRRATADGPPFAWREEEFDLPQSIPIGTYLLRGRAGALERRVLFFVSDLGMVVKRSPTKLLVSLGSLKTGKPFSGVPVVALGGGARIGRPPNPSLPDWVHELGLAGLTFRSDSRGLVEIPFAAANTPSARVVALSDFLGVAMAEAPLTGAASQGGDRLFLYTDRPIYRPGHTVHWKAFARRAAPGGTGAYTMPAGGRAMLTLNGPDGSTIDVPSAPISARGSADGSVTLPAELARGDWTLSASIGASRASATVAVQDYRKPEFRVEVTPDREVYVSGDEVRFVVAATYFFGAPVFGASLRYNLFESRLRSSDGEDDEDGDGEAPGGGGYGRVLKTGETRTDVDGRVALTFTPERVAYDRRLTLEVEVVDGASRTVSGRGSAIMGRGLFTIALRPSRRVIGAGDPVVVEVTTRDHVGRPVSATVTVQLDQEAWNPLERRYVRGTRALAEAQVATGADGRAVASISPSAARSGHVMVRARAEDSRGNRISGETSLWVYDARVVDYAYRYPTLEAFAERQRYQPGDTASVLVNADTRFAEVLATVEGREIHDFKLVRLSGNTGLIRFPIRPEYAPNVFVTVHLRHRRQVQTRSIELSVATARHDLAIALEPDRAEYRPGDSASVAVVTRDGAGRPVPAEVSVGVVDEAIYSLRADATPDPHDIFYGRIPNWISTTVSFPLLYYGGVDKGREEEVRRDFRDVALWAPTVLTDDAGRGEVRLRWPDNLTTWRITSRGATEQTLVGKGVAKTLVSKPLVARLATPRAFIAGDRATLVSVANSRATTAIAGVDQTLEAKGGVRLTGPATRRGDLAPGGEMRVEWPVEAPPAPARGARPREGVLTFRARAKDGGDALELTVPIHPRAVALRSAGSGTMDAGSHTASVPLPPGLLAEDSQVSLDFSPSPAAMALSGVRYLMDYPWGCVEQTANGLLPAAALLAAFQRAGAKAPGWEAPAERFAPYVRRLVSLQSPDGGWGWWREHEFDPYITALALDALARVVALGHGGPEAEQALSSGANRMVRSLHEARSEDGEAYVIAHLTPLLALPQAANRFGPLAGAVGDMAASVYAARERLSPAGLALAARAHADLGRKEQAQRLLDLLLARAERDGMGLHWPASGDDAWFGDDIETTAYALSVLAAIAPADARTASVVNWLAGRRTGGYWRSTRTTGPAIVGLADYLAARPEEAKPDYRLRADWNGVRVVERAIGAQDVFGAGALRIDVPTAALKAGDNRLAITVTGRGRLYYGWEARALVPSPGPAPAEKRVTLTREFLRAERTADRRGRPRFVASPLEAKETFRVGDLVLVRLTLRATRALNHLVLIDPRITGLEVDQLRPDGAEWPWSMHAEERDQGAAFFLDRIGEGETVIEYLMRPEMAGVFTALPAAVEAMYDPSLGTRSGEAVVNVVAR
jgi:alpha-2-macroglobulin